MSKTTLELKINGQLINIAYRLSQLQEAIEAHINTEDNPSDLRTKNFVEYLIDVRRTLNGVTVEIGNQIGGLITDDINSIVWEQAYASEPKAEEAEEADKDDNNNEKP